MTQNLPNKAFIMGTILKLHMKNQISQKEYFNNITFKIINLYPDMVLSVISFGEKQISLLYSEVQNQNSGQTSKQTLMQDRELVYTIMVKFIKDFKVN